MTAQGQAVFASTGDNGAYGRSGTGLNVADPSTQPFVTAVGGTTVFPGPKETYNIEEVWNDLGAGARRHGVAASAPHGQYPRGRRQAGYAVTRGNGGSVIMRNVPDVAAVANPLTGVSVYSAINGGWLTAGGTSVSAPIWAGFYSLVTAASQGLGLGTPGFANPGLYGIGTFGGIAGNAISRCPGRQQRNVEVFGIAGFNAGAGYDNTTGWGSLIADELMVDMIAAPGVGTPPPAPSDVTGTGDATRIKLSWKGDKTDSGYAVIVSPSGKFLCGGVGINPGKARHDRQTCTGHTILCHGLCNVARRRNRRRCHLCHDNW